MKGVGGHGLVSASTDQLLCATDDLGRRARVIDPATREVLMDCPKPSSGVVPLNIPPPYYLYNTTYH